MQLGRLVGLVEILLAFRQRLHAEARVGELLSAVDGGLLLGCNEARGR